MAAKISTILILGARGDLSSRLLLPALGQLLMMEPDRDVRLLGSGSGDWSNETWRALVKKSFDSATATGETAASLASSTEYIQGDVTDPGDLQKLVDACHGVPAIYFALPPAIVVKVCTALEKVTLPPGTVIALEKPFGTDEKSAQELNKQILKLVPEDQIHRVDHFLGRSTVFNLMGLRFANRIFEPLWNSEHIEKVDIVYDEQLALEGRARYYDKAGALVDMIQSHLLQVMAVLAMEPPVTLDATDVRSAKFKILRATHVFNDDPVAFSRRARYSAGEVSGRELGSYVDEPGVDAALGTETLAEVTFGIDTWRWAGVPFTLRSGKALANRRREIVVTFKQVPHLPTGLRGLDTPTILRIALAPDEMSLELNINGPGDPTVLKRASLRAEFGPGQLVAYGEILSGILDGDPALSVRGDAAEQCWHIVAPVLSAWREGAVPLAEYPAGSDGPREWS
ncbi:MAG: glucose-6-phosphate dehydrogenase [Lacisediminihabitans sp.]